LGGGVASADATTRASDATLQISRPSAAVLSVHGVILNFFRFARHRMGSENYRLLRARSFKEWSVAIAE